MIKIMMALFLLAPVLAQVDYDSDVQPIFHSYCTNCHGSAGGLSLTSYNNLMNGSNDGDVVIPYNHSNSLLWIHVNSGYMPPGNNDLTDDQVDLIAQWIDEGALPESNESMLGDVNDDGAVNVLDVVLLVNLILNGNGVGDHYQAEVNGDDM